MHRKNSNIGRYSGHMHISETLLGYLSTPNPYAPLRFPLRKILKNYNSTLHYNFKYPEDSPCHARCLFFRKIMSYSCDLCQPGQLT